MTNNDNCRKLLKRVENRLGTKIGFSKVELSEAGNISQSQNNLIIEFFDRNFSKIRKIRR